MQWGRSRRRRTWSVVSCNVGGGGASLRTPNKRFIVLALFQAPLGKRSGLRVAEPFPWLRRRGPKAASASN
eukprot:scaffold206_cov400-Prasinococcus_capsulatus_cf.AAC.12